LPAAFLDPGDGDSITSETSQKVLYVVTAVRVSDPTQLNYFCKIEDRISEMLMGIHIELKGKVINVLN
jgi:hypothetical protein